MLWDSFGFYGCNQAPMCANCDVDCPRWFSGILLDSLGCLGVTGGWVGDWRKWEADDVMGVTWRHVATFFWWKMISVAWRNFSPGFGCPVSDSIIFLSKIKSGSNPDRYPAAIIIIVVYFFFWGGGIIVSVTLSLSGSPSAIPPISSNGLWIWFESPQFLFHPFKLNANWHGDEDPPADSWQKSCATSEILSRKGTELPDIRNSLAKFRDALSVGVSRGKIGGGRWIDFWKRAGWAESSA